MIWRHLVVLLLAIMLGSSAAQAATGQSADITAALAEVSKVMQKGAYAKAIEMVDEALRSGKIPSDMAAKALLLRAESNEKLGRTAFALSDYNSALWMEGLSDADRKHAEEGKARVTASLGVPATKTDTAAKSPPGGGTAPAARSPEPNGAQAPSAAVVQQQPAEQANGSSEGIGGFFNNLFGSSTTSQQRPPAQQEQPSTAVAVTAPAVAEQQPPQPKAPPKKAAAAAAKAAKQPAAAPATAQGPVVTAATKPETGSFAIQLAAVDQEDKAIAETDRIAKKYGADLGGRSPSLMIVPTADGGTLYKVVLAPYETRGEGVATCELLKSKGLSCMVIVKK